MRLCERCNKNPAIIHIRKQAGKVISEHYICGQCAKELNFKIVSFSKINNFVSDLMPLSENEIDDRIQCSVCSSTPDKIKKTGKVGCANCYSVFGSQLDVVINKIHGTRRHLNNYEKELMGENKKDDLLELKNSLKEAIKNEEYEKAVIYRDKIKALEAKANG